jgi:hypothetical protein
MMQQLSAPVYSQLKVNSNFTPSGAGAYFAVQIDGNESGIGYRAAEDNTLPTGGNERVKQARVLPKKLYAVCTFSGLAEAVSQRGGEDAFANGVTNSLSMAVRRVGAIQEVTFLRGDGTGRLTNLDGNATTNVVDLDDARMIRPGQVVQILDNNTGLIQAGPVTVLSKSQSGPSMTTSAVVTASDNNGVYIFGEQSGAAAPAEITPLGLPKLVNNLGTIYNLSRTTYPILQSQVIDASTTSLDEDMLRRLRRRIMVETAAETVDGYAMISNHEQFDRYTEIALPFRRFNDMRLELGAQQDVTTFEGRPWFVTWAADPSVVYFLNLGAIERGVVRPMSIDERISMQWVPGQDAFSTVLKGYHENVGRALNQSGKITALTVPTW